MIQMPLWGNGRALNYINTSGHSGEDIFRSLTTIRWEVERLALAQKLTGAAASNDVDLRIPKHLNLGSSPLEFIVSNITGFEPFVKNIGDGGNGIWPIGCPDQPSSSGDDLQAGGWGQSLMNQEV